MRFYGWMYVLVGALLCYALSGLELIGALIFWAGWAVLGALTEINDSIRGARP